MVELAKASDDSTLRGGELDGVRRAEDVREVSRHLGGSATYRATIGLNACSAQVQQPTDRNQWNEHAQGDAWTHADHEHQADQRED